MQFAGFHPVEARKMGQDYIQAGLISQLLGVFTLAIAVTNHARNLVTVCNIVIVLATIVLIAGLSKLATYFKRNRWWAMLGLLSLAGVLALLAIIASDDSSGNRKDSAFEVITAKAYRRDVWRMDITVWIDPRLSPSCGNDPIQLQLPRGASIQSAMKILTQVLPELSAVYPKAAFSINQEKAKLKDDLSNGDFLRVIPLD